MIITISKEVTQKRRQVSPSTTISPIWVYKVSLETDEIRAELDSHADTCVVGKPALILRDYERPVKVHGYDKSMGTTVYTTVDAAIGYDCPKTGTLKVLVINQAIHMPKLNHHLLNPLQMRLNDVIVNECPKFLTREPTDRTHALIVRDDTLEEELLIPLDLRGVTGYFPCTELTKEQYDNAEELFSLTYDTPEWDPGTETFALKESTMTDGQGRARQHAKLPKVTVAVTGTDDGCIEDLAGSLESNIHLVTTLGSSQEPMKIESVSSEGEPFDAARLAKNWGIGLQTAKNTIRATTQRGVRTVLHPSLSRRFRTNDRQLRYRRLPIEVFTDTMFAKTKSRRGNTAAQVFTSRTGWKRVFPMTNKGFAHEALSLLFARDGVPSTLIVDGSKEQNLGQFKQKARQADCHIRTLEPYTPWANAAESGIRELKRGSQRKMFRSGCPKRLWDDCIEFESYVQSNTASNSFEARGEVPETIVSGETSDISVWCQHGWYDWVMFRDSSVPYPEDKWVLGRYLGPSLDYSPAMTAKMLKANGQVVHRSTYRDLTEEEAATPALIANKDEFNKQVHIKLGPSMAVSDFEKDEVEAITPEYDLYEDDSGEAYKREAVDVVTPEEGDGYINAEVLLSKGGELVSGVVKRRERTKEGELKGLKNDNPILDTRTYEVEFPDGEVSAYTANVIAENMWAQCDIEGNQFRLMAEIVDYEKNGHALKQSDMHVVVNGRKHVRKTTTGWKLCVQWKDGSTSWESLSGLKESNPVEVAEYAVAQGIEHEPAFAWWVPHTLRKRNRVIASVNKRYFKTTHKYGLRIPKSVNEAKAIDRENGNTLWMDAIAKELADVRVAFDVLADGAAVPVGSQEIRCHLVFDIKMEDFRRKARYVAGGQVTEPPKTITYASVVSRESVRIALTVAALNALQVKASDIQNAYLTAPNQEKIWTVMGPEWGPLAGKRAVIKRALYGLKSAGASFRSHLADCMRTMGYTPCLADPDVWLRPMVRPEDGKKYYAYMLLYVDDCLCIHHDAQHELERLDKYFQMKPGSIGDPNFYLGAKLRTSKLANGVTAWGMSSSKYLKEAVANVEAHLRKQSLSLSKRAATPFVADYRPEMDMSKELDPATANYFQSQIGILRWMVELGRVDIITEVSALASHLALPREGHLEAVYHIYAYLKGKHNATMIFDPTYPDIDESIFQKCDWKEFYGDVTEAIPLNRPEPRGKEVDIRLFVDSSHADDKTNRRSRTGYFIFLNSAPVGWLSRKQATIETSVFGAEFVAMKQGMEAVRGLRYKLRMMGIPISGPTYIYGDNMSVINNTQKPESMLKKKSNSICYHAVRESVAMGESITAHISTNENCADLATKVVPGGRKRDYLVSLLLHDLVDDHYEEEERKQPPPTKKVRYQG